MSPTHYFTHLIILSFLCSPGVAASSFFTSGKYAIDPELRGAEFERITQNLDVHFWKTFWNITETEVLSVSRLLMLLFCLSHSLSRSFTCTHTHTHTHTRICSYNVCNLFPVSALMHHTDMGAVFNFKTVPVIFYFSSDRNTFLSLCMSAYRPLVIIEWNSIYSIGFMIYSSGFSYCSVTWLAL